MRATDALRVKREMAEWYDTMVGREFCDEMTRVVRSHDPHSYMGQTNEPLSVRLRRDLERAETYFVTPHMVDLVEHAAMSMPEEVLLATDLPTDCGFVFLDRPVKWSNLDAMIGVPPEVLREAGIEKRVHCIAAFSWARGMVHSVARRDGQDVVMIRGQQPDDEHVLIEGPRHQADVLHEQGR